MSEYLGLIWLIGVVIACYLIKKAWNAFDKHMTKILLLYKRNERQLALLRQCYPIVKDFTKIAAVSQMDPDKTHTFILSPNTNDFYQIKSDLEGMLLESDLEK